MNSNLSTTAPAIAEPQDALKILQDVSQVYEKLRDIRIQAATIAHGDGATYQALGEAMGTTRSAAHQLINRNAA